MSEERDPRVVHVSPTLETAGLVAAWLGEKGFLCEVVAPEPPADGTAPAEPPPAGVEIRVIDVDQAEKAKEAIEQARALRALYDKRMARTGTVTAPCEECGKDSAWPAAEMGSTQECPHCGRYMDVPDPEDDWGEVDFGSPDGDDEGGTAPEGK